MRVAELGLAEEPVMVDLEGIETNVRSVSSHVTSLKMHDFKCLSAPGDANMHS